MTSEYPCPVCGFSVFNSPSGGYEVCPVCDWEDDPVQLKYPELSGGANRTSFWKTQRSILKTIPVEESEYVGYSRDARWRPMTEAEIVGKGGPDSGREYFDAIPAKVEPYYWENDA